MSPRKPEIGPAAALFAGSGAVAVVVAVANVATLGGSVEVARLRDLRLLARLRLGLDAYAPDLLAHLPSVLHAPFDLRAAPGLAAFLASAVAAHLLLGWMLAAVAAPVVVPLVRRRAAAGTAWPRGYPLAVIATALVPLVAHRLSLWTTAGPATIAIASIVLTATLWFVALHMPGAHLVLRPLVPACVAVTLVGSGLALGGGGLLLARATMRDGARILPPPGAPNILLISIDTLRPDHLGSYGYGRDTSPTLDALAAAGARFATVISPTSWTLPAHVTLLTALPPEVHGVVDDALRLDESVVTLAEVLQARGYATAGFVSGPYLDAGYGFARGFDHYDDYSAVRISRPAVHQAHTSPQLLAIVSNWLDAWESVAPRRPFFVFVHMWDPHYDFNPPPPYDTLFDPDYTGSVTGDDFENSPTVHADMSPRDLAHVVALYDGEIRYTDAYVARMLETLRRRNALDDTIVVVTSDHGEEFFEHGMKGHRNALYDESIRVPLIIRHPARIAAGTVVERQVRLLDVAPTILALTATPPPPSFGLDPTLGPYAGQSLLPFLTVTPPPTSSLPAFADLHPHAIHALRHESQKLIVAPLKDPSTELFDLETDPRERTNLAPTDPTGTQHLRHELTRWQDTARLAAKQAREATMSEDHKEALRALGYVE